MSQLHTETFGSGPDLVLVHGWGLHGDIWQPIIEPLSQHFRVTTVDLPGHGHSHLVAGGFDLMRLSQLILDSIPQNSIWVGWSLGGMAGLNAAIHYPDRINKLVLVAAQAQFFQTDDWPHATPTNTLAAFTDNLTKNTDATLKRFLALQVQGTPNEKALLRELRNIVDSRPHPQEEALRLGLEILKSANLRPLLNRLLPPTQVILGQRDMLVPVAAADMMRPLMANADIRIIAKAGHAPFLSHPQAFLAALTEFLKA